MANGKPRIISIANKIADHVRVELKEAAIGGKKGQFIAKPFSL